MCNDQKSQSNLYRLYCHLLGLNIKRTNIPDSMDDIAELRRYENPWITYEDQRIQSATLPDNVENFKDWFNAVTEESLAHTKPIFDYLGCRANLHDLSLFTYFYGEVDDHFADLVAFAQTGMDHKVKLTIAENYWDEMGNGDANKIHISLFRQSIHQAKIYLQEVDTLRENAPMLESLKNANLLLMYALRRRYLPRLLGALGIQESTGSQRFSAIAKGLRKNNANKAFLKYYEVHAECDAGHGEEWLNQVIVPEITSDVSVIPEICKGILTHNRISIDHFYAIAGKLPEFKQRYKRSA